MPIVQHHAHHRAGMYGLAGHPRHYERFAAVLAGPLYRRVVADVTAQQLPAGAVVLDIGTGPGRVPMMIAEKCPHLSVTGVDLSPEMIAHATVANGHVSGPGQVGFQVADVANLPFADGSVDLSCRRSACTTGTTSPPASTRWSASFAPEPRPGSTTSDLPSAEPPERPPGYRPKSVSRTRFTVAPD